jgi:hypothetical protein
MSCPSCTENKTDFYYSGADIFGEEVRIPGVHCGLCHAPEYPNMSYPRLEIRKCPDCGAVWLMDYFWADHPPLILGGKVLHEPKVIAAAVSEILGIMDENLKTGSMKQDEFDQSSRCLASLLNNVLTG